MSLVKRFIIGRYYFNSLFKEEAEESFIEDLMKEPFISEHNFDYAIGNIETEEEKSHIILRGTFGRMRRGTIAQVYDKRTKEFKQETLPEIADAVLEFLIYHEKHLIFIEHSSVISPAYFVDKFRKIYANSVSIADFGIEFIFIEKDVYKTIKKWTVVDKIYFKKLRPSNPSSLDDFAEIESLLKETNSEKTSIIFQAPERRDAENRGLSGLNYESTLIRQSLALSAHGYGEARLVGQENGEVVEVQSRRFLKKVEIDFGSDGALDKIVQTVEEISNPSKHDK